MFVECRYSEVAAFALLLQQRRYDGCAPVDLGRWGPVDREWVR